MTRLRPAPVLLARMFVLAVCSSLASACVDEDGSTTGGGVQAEGVDAASVGQLDLALSLGTGVELGTLTYLVAGPGGFSKTGNITLTGTDALVAIIGPLPVGTGFTVVVSSPGGAGLPTCTGTATFVVTAGSTTLVAVHVRCQEPRDQGSVLINGTINVCPIIDGVGANPARAFVGSPVALSASAHDLDGAPAALAYAWTTSSGMITNPTAAAASFTCPDVGSVAITLQVTDGDCGDRAAINVICVPAPGADGGVGPGGVPSTIAVKINEVESNGGTPGDWVELLNLATTTADLSGYVFRDNDNTHTYVLPAGTAIAPGAYLVLEEAAFGFGLGGADSARLFAPGGTSIVDSHEWTAHAAVTYSRCPNGSGPFVASASTKGGVNACAVPDSGTPDAGAGPDSASDGGTEVTLLAWPGRNQVATIDNVNQFGDNLSGLSYQPATSTNPAVLWAALNSPSVLYRMVASGTTWTFDTTDGWGSGKNIQYPTGTGNPDFEGLTKTEWDSPFVYAATERNNDASSVSRLSILRVDTSVAGSTLVATHEWNLNGDLPSLGPNLGLEAITWVPDSYLTANQFTDERLGTPYNPANYPAHGNGLFLTGVEGTGIIYAYALDHSAGTFKRVATIPSGHPGVMGLEFDRDSGALWAHCDNTCANVSNVLGVVNGRFTVRRRFARPSTLPDSNNEGIAIAPDSSCQGGLKSIFWSDDSHFAGHALRVDAIPCGPLF